eukprot:scaffold57140_cov27-Tisochrysis_lutea.AAC.1
MRLHLQQRRWDHRHRLLPLCSSSRHGATQPAVSPLRLWRLAVCQRLPVIPELPAVAPAKLLGLTALEQPRASCAPLSDDVSGSAALIPPECDGQRPVQRIAEVAPLGRLRWHDRLLRVVGLEGGRGVFNVWRSRRRTAQRRPLPPPRRCRQLLCPPLARAGAAPLLAALHRHAPVPFGGHTFTSLL